AGVVPRAGAREAGAGCGAEADAGVHADSAQDGDDSSGGRDGILRNAGAAIFPAIGFSVPGAWDSLSDRTGRRAETERDFVHSRRRISVRRNEAWAKRAD